jgi:hypothetical protein
MNGNSRLVGMVAATTLALGLAWQMPARAQNGSNGNPPTQSKLDTAAAKAERKALVGENMQLSDSEAKAFWPLYDQYEARMDRVDKRHAAEIRAYARAYQNFTEDDAKSKLDEVMAVAQQRLDIQKEYIPKFRAVLSQTKTTRFFQIDNKIHALIQCQIAQLVPLVGTGGQAGAGGGAGGGQQ